MDAGYGSEWIDKECVSAMGTGVGVGMSKTNCYIYHGGAGFLHCLSFNTISNSHKEKS